jgi:hypothetical protein
MNESDENTLNNAAGFLAWVRRMSQRLMRMSILIKGTRKLTTCTELFGSLWNTSRTVDLDLDPFRDPSLSV